AAITKAATTRRSASAATSRRCDNRPIDDRRLSWTRSVPGTTASSPTLSCGHACTQSRQNVQSRLPALRGRNRSSSQPRRLALPRMQSCVVQVAHTAGSRTATSSGDISELTNWNCPIGHTYLQKLAPRQRLSTTSAAAKYAAISHAVALGASHRPKVSEDQKKTSSRTAASHLVRIQRGSRRVGGDRQRAIARRSRNGA